MFGGARQTERTQTDGVRWGHHRSEHRGKVLCDCAESAVYSAFGLVDFVLGFRWVKSYHWLLSIGILGV